MSSEAQEIITRIRAAKKRQPYVQGRGEGLKMSPVRDAICEHCHRGTIQSAESPENGCMCFYSSRSGTFKGTVTFSPVNSTTVSSGKN